MTRYFVETLGGVLITKHAVGEDRLVLFGGSVGGVLPK
jgi:hypothetical protein